MIHLVQGTRLHFHPQWFEAMHRNRAQVFSYRLRWDVVVVDGYEFDHFDQINPLYVIAVDDITQQYLGSVRMLPTTGPNMLRDVFPYLLPDGDVIESPNIWEASRFAITRQAERVKVGNDLNFTTFELLCGSFEMAIMAGLSHLVAVFDDRMLRIFQKADCAPEIIGTPQVIGRTLSYAGVFETSSETLAQLRNKAGITKSVLAENSETIATAFAA